MKLGAAIVFISSLAFQPLPAAAAPQYGHFPLSFETSDPGYLARGDGYSLRIKPRSAQVTLRNGKQRSEISMHLAGALWSSTLEAADLLPARANHFHGADPARWRTNIPTYSKLRARSIYPGIDLVYYGNQTRLEYDFVVSPGADASRIHLKFDGMTALNRDDDGNLILRTPAGDVTQRRPIAYQLVAGQRREIASRFILGSRGQVTFALGNYDHTAPLIIDPVLSYASFLGGTATEERHAIAVDSAGNAYIAGITNSTDRGDAKAFLRKINPTGTAVLYQASFGGSGTDEANAVAVDSAGNIFVAGRTNSPNFPLTAAFQNGNAGGIDGFLLRVNPNTNQLIFSTYFGGSGEDRVLAMSLDPSGNAYITGGTSSTDLQTNQAAFQRQNAGGVDAFVAKFDPQGNALLGTYLGGAADDRGYGITTDSAGNIFLTGSTDSNNFPLSGAGQGTRQGKTDAFVTKMDRTGSTLQFSTYLGGSENDIAQAIALDPGGNIYVAGSTASGDFPIVNGSYQTNNAGGDTDMFVSKLSLDGRSLAYSTYIGSRGSDVANAIAIDGTGQAFITGSSNSDVFPVTSDAQQRTRAGGSDVVLVKLNQSGSALLYSTFLGGSNDETGRGVAVDASGSAYIAGITSSRNFPSTGQSVSPSYNGGDSDGFVAKISFPSTPPTLNAGGVVNGASFTATPLSPGSLITIFGNNFASAAVGASSTPLPNTLGGVSVTINGIAAPLVYVGTNQINLQLPFEVTPGNASVVVTGPGGASSTGTFAVGQAGPGLFTSNNRAIAQNQDFSLNTPSNPAKGGSVVVVYLTGQGPLDNRVPTGAALTGSASATLPYSATIGGVNAPVLFVGLTQGFVGLAQANIVVPSLASGDYPLVLTVGGVQSNSAVIAVSSQ
ncbi:MAG: SBBP repeat-containing protein [Acidobacteriota bacterium]|nr:SBBP repeat-containing protein [Acidobacteriota bacterium]